MKLIIDGVSAFVQRMAIDMIVCIFIPLRTRLYDKAETKSLSLDRCRDYRELVFC